MDCRYAKSRAEWRAQKNLSLMTRRAFLSKSALATLAVSGPALIRSYAAALGLAHCPVGVFSKVYQELSLSFQETAEVTAEAGLDGIDCPVRPGGQIPPER